MQGSSDIVPRDGSESWSTKPSERQQKDISASVPRPSQLERGHTQAVIC